MSDATKCPNCGANLEIVDGADHFFCKYCGTKVEVNLANREIVHRSIDETKIEKERIKKELAVAKMEHARERERIKHDREVERHERIERQSKWTYVRLAIYIIIAILMTLSMRR